MKAKKIALLGHLLTKKCNLRIGTHSLFEALSVAAILLLPFASLAQVTPRQTLSGHVPPAAGRAKPVGRVSGATELKLAIGLPLRNRAVLSNLLHQIYDPASPQFRHYLTPKQFAERFGPTREDYQALVAFTKAHGWTVTGTHPNRMLLDVSASAASVEKVFHLTLQVFQHPTEGRTFYAPDREPGIDLNVPLLHIGGLDNFIMPHPMNLRVRPVSQAKNATPTGTGSGTGGTFLGSDFRAAYVPGVTATGVGQTVGLLEFDSGFYSSDITAYEALASLPNVPVQAVLLDGYGGGPGEANDEVSLDIEMAISLAPGLSQVLVYEGSTTDDILNRMATDNLAKQLSASWGYPIDATSDQIFLEYAAQGQTFFNASGDSDAYPGTPYPPSDDPNITVVGGTTLTTTGPGGSWASETVWNWGTEQGLDGVGSSGGISTSVPLPSWQQGIDMSANGGSTMYRNLPDVALTADNVLVLYGNGGSGDFGGTSCAAPLWAAFMALVNQQATENAAPLAGFINPAIYSLGVGPSFDSVFNDITTGNNTWRQSSGRFYAVAGYDLCTGWGTPNGNNLINALAGPPVPTPPSITQQPQSQTVPTAGIAVFTVSVTGSFPLSYQWSCNTTNIPGATNSLLNLTNVVQAQAGNYAVLVTNAYGITLSSNAVLTVNPPIPPTVTIQPSNITITLGNNGSFAGAVAGTPPLSYQWQFNSNNVVGATNATLTLTDVQYSNAGNYSFVVSSPYGSTNSSNAVLTVASPVCTFSPSGIIGWWPAEGNTIDIIGGNNGTLVGSVTYVSGKVGQAFSFNGNGDGVVVGNPASLQLQNFTIDTWIQRASTSVATSDGTDGLIFAYGSGGYGLGMSHINGSVFLTQIDASNVAVPVGLTDTNWHHLAVTKNGSTVIFYVDGVAYPAPAYNPSFSFGSSAAIGTRADTFGNSFLGAIDEVDVFNRALAASEIQAIYNAGSAGKCSYFPPTITAQPFSETIAVGNNASFAVQASGTAPLNYQWQFDSTNISGATNPVLNLVDVQPASAGTYSVVVSNAYGSVSSSNATLTISTTGCVAPPSGVVGWWPAEGNAFDIVGGNNGTLAGSVSYVPGEVGQAFSLNGNGDGVVVGNPASLQLQNFTIDTWIQRASTSIATSNGTDGLIFAYGSGGYGLGMSHINGSVFLTQIDASSVAVPVGLTDTSWHHLAVTKNGSTVIFYVDGVAYPAPDYNPFFTFGSSAAIGTRADRLSNSFLGAIDEVDVFNRALSASEIQAIYNAGSAGKCLASPPSITIQPSSQTIVAGNTAAFTVITAGTPILSYQWQFNGTNLTGAKSSVLTLANVQAANAGSYSVTVTNVYGSVVSSNAALTVHLPPTITTQPASQSVIAGSNATFNVVAAGDPPLGYQWRFNSTNISGATTTSLTLTNVQLANGGNYSVIVTNTYGSVTSSSAALTIETAPSITTQPTNQTVVSGSTATITVVAVGTAPLNYQWQFDGTNLGGATRSALALATVQPTNAGIYSVTVSNAYGFVISSNATLTVHVKPSVVTQPTAQIVVLGSNATFSVTAAGDPPLGYQWRFNGSNINNATSTSFTVTNVQLTNEGSYSVIVTNAYGSVASSSASLVVNEPGCVVPPSGVVGWWPADGNAGDVAGGNNGTLAGSVSYVPGEVGQAFSLNGNGDGVVVGNPASLQLQNFTIDTWIQRASTSIATSNGTDGLIFAYGSGGYGLGMSHINGSVFLTQIDASSDTVPVGLTDTSWHHLAVTKNGSTVIFYVDGVAYPAPAYNPFFTFGSSAAIGTRADRLSNSFLGAIDEVDVFNRALSASEIQAIYNAGSAGKCGVNGAPPSITNQPSSQTVQVGSSVIFSVGAAGAPPLTYQWQFNSTNITGATASVLDLTNVQIANAGNYSVLIASPYGSVASSNAMLTINTLPPSISSQPTNQSVVAGGTAQFSVMAGGATPLSFRWRFNGFNLTDNGSTSGSTTSALTLSDVTSAEGGMYSVTVSNAYGTISSSNALLTVIPTYPLSATSAGGGLVIPNPLLSQYPSNSTVNLTASPAGGWSFLNWLDDAQGSNPSYNLIINSSKKVIARFGTALNTATFGGGSVTVIPAMPLYPYGQSVRLVAQPQPGNYFVRWTNSASGANNPLTLSVQNNNLTIGAVFAPLTNGSYSLTVLTEGFGQTSAAPPGKNVFTNGAIVTLTATPDAGQSFLGWSGSASGTNNPLVVAMNQNQLITANFTFRPSLTIQSTSDSQGVLLTLTGAAANVYSIQKSSDLMTWTNLQTVTNVYGESQLTDGLGTNKWFFYQAVEQ